MLRLLGVKVNPFLFAVVLRSAILDLCGGTLGIDLAPKHAACVLVSVFMSWHNFVNLTLGVNMNENPRTVFLRDWTRVHADSPPLGLHVEQDDTRLGSPFSGVVLSVWTVPRGLTPQALTHGLRQFSRV